MAQESRPSPGSTRPIVAWVIVGILAVSVPRVAVVSYAVGVRSGRRILNLETRMTEVLVFQRDMDAGENISLVKCVDSAQAFDKFGEAIAVSQRE